MQIENRMDKRFLEHDRRLDDLTDKVDFFVRTEIMLYTLHGSLYPVSQELNEIDCKDGLSDKTTRLALHICALASLNEVDLWCLGKMLDEVLDA